MKSTRVIVTGVVFALSGLPGCATLSEGECRTADWYQIGREDGRRGQERDRLFSHREACAAYGVRVDPDAYDAGRQAGLGQYCTPDNGYRAGREGRPYRGVCPAKYEHRFLAEYRKGETVHGVIEAIDEIEREINRKEAQLADEDTPEAQADRLRQALRQRLYELRHLNRELMRLERRYETDHHEIR